MLYAAIDIGTVTCRLLIVEANEGIERECVRECRITNLGIGVSQDKLLRPDAIERVVACVAEYRAICDAMARERGLADLPLVAVATSAARDARNAADLISALARIGVDLDVIPGMLEADLSFRGASAEFPGERIAVVDVGGGSTEVIFGDARDGVAFSHSFDIGCRRITEMFFHSDPPTPDELERARAYVETELSAVLAGSPFRLESSRVVAVAGTATSVVSIDQAMEVYDPSRVHRTLVGSSTLDEVFRMLAHLPEEQRRHVVGLEPKRAGVIVAGMLILQCVLSVLGQDSFTVSESDILQGIIMAQLEEKTDS